LNYRRDTLALQLSRINRVQSNNVVIHKWAFLFIVQLPVIYFLIFGIQIIKQWRKQKGQSRMGNKSNNEITELRTILQRESQN